MTSPCCQITPPTEYTNKLNVTLNGRTMFDRIDYFAYNQEFQQEISKMNALYPLSCRKIRLVPSRTMNRNVINMSIRILTNSIPTHHKYATQTTSCPISKNCTDLEDKHHAIFKCKCTQSIRDTLWGNITKKISSLTGTNSQTIKETLSKCVENTILNKKSLFYKGLLTKNSYHKIKCKNPKVQAQIQEEIVKFHHRMWIERCNGTILK